MRVLPPDALYGFRMTLAACPSSPTPLPPGSPTLLDAITFCTSILYFCSPSPCSSPWHPQEQGGPRDLQLPLVTPPLTWACGEMVRRKVGGSALCHPGSRKKREAVF